MRPNQQHTQDPWEAKWRTFNKMTNHLACDVLSKNMLFLMKVRLKNYYYYYYYKNLVSGYKWYLNNNKGKKELWNNQNNLCDGIFTNPRNLHLETLGSTGIKQRSLSLTYTWLVLIIIWVLTKCTLANNVKTL